MVPPPGVSNDQQALKKEKEIKYTLTDDPSQHKSFNRALRQSKAQNMNRISPPKYDKRQSELKKATTESQIKSATLGKKFGTAHTIRPDLDNALNIIPAPIGLKKEEHLYKF